MAVETPTPTPRLAEVAHEARADHRAQKRASNPVLKAFRKVAVVVAMLFATLGLGGGVAQAWPWDVADNITAFVTNFCDPMDVPQPSNHVGLDTLFGLNSVEDSDIRHTVQVANPEANADGSDGLGALERIQTAYTGTDGDAGVDDAVVHPQYERYGFSTLHWNNYGSGCFSVGYWFSPFSNIALMIFVHIPMILSMVTLDLALGNIIYDVFAVLLAPFVSIFGEIFTPWIYFIAGFGIIFVWITRRSTQAVMKAAVWILAITGMFFWMSNNTTEVIRVANNFVTEIAGSAADAINENNQGHNTGDDIEADGSALQSINQSLWFGIPYQAWAEGTIGPSAAAGDRARERGTDGSSELGFGPAILNSHYVGDDDTGAQIRQNIQYWNSLTYAPGDSEEEKTGYWTGADGGSFWTGTEYNDAAWVDIPYLYNIKALCADTVTSDEGGSDDEADNLWMYADNCNMAAAGTSNIVPYFTGENFNQRLITAATGGVAAMSVSLAVSGAALYLALQKMVFYFLMLFAPLFLAISTFADEKRRAFATRYFGVLAGNIIKQAVAVLVVLFVANSMSLLMYPPDGETFAALRSIPWILKPVIAILFFIALILFAIPMKKVITAAAKGDTSVVQKTADAPKNAAKTTAKVAAVGGLVAATGGVAGAAVAGGAGAAGAAGGAGSALGGAKGAALLQTAGRAVGARGGAGKLLTTAGRVSSMRNQVGSAMAQRKGNKEALQNGVKAMTSGQKGQEYVSALSKKPGMVNPDGSLTKAGNKQAQKDFAATSKLGAEKQAGAQMQAAQMKQFFEGHKAKTGQYHEHDPQSPQNIKAAKVAHEQERQGIHSEAAANRKRDEYQGNAQNVGGPNAANSNQQATPASANNNQQTTTPTAANASNNDGKDPTPASTDATAHDNNVREAFAQQARGNMDGPSFGRDENIKATVQVSGAEILSQMGMDRASAAAEPTALLSGSAYNGGDTSKMDPAHPATAAMNDMRFATMSGSDEDSTKAINRASEAIAEHGVPNEISSIGSTGATAQNFNSAQVVGAMPNITEDTPWQERAEAATTMQAATAMVPEDSPAAEPMRSYVSALSSPNVGANEVDGLKVQAMEAFAQADESQPALFDAAPMAASGAGAAFVGAPATAGPNSADAGPAPADVGPAPAEAEAAPQTEQQSTPRPMPVQETLPGMDAQSAPEAPAEAPAPVEPAPQQAAQEAAPADPAPQAAQPVEAPPSYGQPSSAGQDAGPSFGAPAPGPAPAESAPADEAPPNYDQSSGPDPQPSSSDRAQGMSREDFRDVMREVNEDARLNTPASYDQAAAPVDQPQAPGPDVNAPGPDVNAAAPAVPTPGPASDGPAPDTPAPSQESGPARGGPETPTSSDSDEVQEFTPTRRRRRSSFFSDDEEEERKERERKERDDEDEREWWRNATGRERGW